MRGRGVWPVVAGLGLILPMVASGQEATPTQSTSEQSTARAADTQPADAAKPEEITVTANKSSGTRIDRRVYDVKTDPQASTGQLSDVLAKVPSVTVTADDKIYLRGDSGVTIWVDGKAPPEGRQVLRTLPASEIERIEVITNPSAQYAAGTAKGIINIITKKRQTVKRRGTMSARVDELGGYSGGISYDDGKGPWSWGFGLNGTKQFSDFAYESVREGMGTGVASGRMEQSGYTDVRNQSQSGSLRLGYKTGPRGALKLAVSQNAMRYDGWRWNRARDDAGAYNENAHDRWQVKTWDHCLTYTFADDKGERLTLEVSDSLNQQINPIRYVIEDARPGRSDGERRTDEIWRLHERQIKGDYEKPLGGDRLLSAGFDWQAQAQNTTRLFDSSFVTEASTRNRFFGRETTSSAYVTLQWPLGKWTAMPGLRAEDRRRRFPGQTLVAGGGETEWFPSLHLSRSVGTGRKLRFSYSRRLDPVPLNQYDPQIIYNSTTSARSGNADLQLILVHSLEASYEVERKTSGWGVTVYYRDASNQIITVSELRADGVQLSRPANLGQARIGGFDLNWRSPIAGLPGKGRWSHTSSAGYKYGQAVVAAQAGDRETVFWQARSVIRYDGPKRGAVGGDQFQATLSAFANLRDIETQSDPYWNIDLSWQRALTPKLVLAVSAPYILRKGSYNSSAVTDTYRSEQTTYRPNGYFRVALNYKFGSN